MLADDWLTLLRSRGVANISQIIIVQDFGRVYCEKDRH